MKGVRLIVVLMLSDLLLTTYYLLPTTYYLLLTTYYLRPNFCLELAECLAPLGAW